MMMILLLLLLLLLVWWWLLVLTTTTRKEAVTKWCNKRTQIHTWRKPNGFNVIWVCFYVFSIMYIVWSMHIFFIILCYFKSYILVYTLCIIVFLLKEMYENYYQSLLPSKILWSKRDCYLDFLYFWIVKSIITTNRCINQTDKCS